MTDSSRGYQQFFAELKRRRVFRVMAVYGVIGFGIIEAAGEIFPRVGVPDWAVTLVVWLALLGFPVAVVLAWAFESSPEGMKRTQEASSAEIDAILSAPASQRWRSGILALIGAAVLLVGAWYAGRQSAPAGGDAGLVASIAVLPFADMSPNKDQVYFSDGISEELLNLLARIPELHVAARTSSFSFRDQSLEVTEIADRLNVAHVLEGSVRWSGDQVRITAQLIRAHDGFHLWSVSWDRPADDIFAIQDEIAEDVVEQLKISLLGEVPTADVIAPEAYALFLQARQLGHQFTPPSLEQSNRLYQQALEIDPEYAAAWAGLAGNYVQQGRFVFRPINEAFRLGVEAAERALAIDPDNASAYVRLSRVAMQSDNDLAAAARHLERALALAPNDLDVISDAGSLLRALGRRDESIPLAEYVVSRDPVNPSALSRLGFAYIGAGRPDEALASFRKAESLFPGRTGSRQSIGQALLDMGEPEAALVEMRQETFEPFRLIGLAWAHHALGQAAESDSALAQLIDKYEEGWAYNIAYVLARRGESDRAFEWLDKAVEYKDTGLDQIPGNTLFTNLHDDLRWLPFLESIGKSPEQLAAVEFEVRLP
jgi:TolB-like protein/Tfp pilus assembly protein PilF